MSGLPKFSRAILGPIEPASVHERRTTVFNDSEQTSGPPPSNRSASWYGKFFPRGMRGVIQEIQVYCQSDVGHTVVARISPSPGLGYTHYVGMTGTTEWGWRSGTLSKMWDFDSLFIYLYNCGAGLFWGYDDESPPDGHLSIDSGAKWTGPDERPYIRIVYSGMTSGDVPVAGSVSTVILPVASSIVIRNTVAVPENVEKKILEVEGAGFCDLTKAYVLASASSDDTIILMYCDGVLVYSHSFDYLHQWGYGPHNQPEALIKHKVDGVCVMQLTKKWEFKRIFKVSALNTDSAVTAGAEIHPNLIR